jgi:hypothetical protein
MMMDMENQGQLISSNYLIIQRLAGIISNEDVKQFRLVKTLWHDLSEK